jgi:aconitase B
MAYKLNKKSTIFDLTNDVAIIEEVLGYLPEKEEYEKTASIQTKVSGMFDYAELVKDDKLTKQLNELFADELATLFPE